jgi:hypothetical protein
MVSIRNSVVEKISTNPSSNYSSCNSGSTKISITYGIFLMPLLEASPRIIVATKNPIKIPESMSNSMFKNIFII